VAYVDPREVAAAKQAASTAATAATVPAASVSKWYGQEYGGCERGYCGCECRCRYCWGQEIL